MWAIDLLHTNRVPDWLTRLGVRIIVRSNTRERYRSSIEERDIQRRDLIQKLKRSPIATHPDDANRQHYRVPLAFFELVLGRRLKYSCCHWPEEVPTLNEAEDAMLGLSCRRARLRDGTDVLDLDCGWGSLSLWITEHYPACRATAVSNSPEQVAYIEKRCREEGLDNVETLVADVNDLRIDRRFDRVISIEMFEHVKNYER
jgi:cyclopropane-fatty-acyl-phospholipid synthase